MMLTLYAHSAQAQKQDKIIHLATTSSVQNSGLLDILLERFHQQSGIIVRATIQGSGLAIQSARDGNTDMILTHAPQDEEKFVASGYGVKRHLLMYNEFVIVGPTADPAQINGMPVLMALQKIADSKSKFVSRGDDSGTHQKEKALWQMLNISDQLATKWFAFGRHWYQQSGAGMGQSLTIAFEKDAYILTDYGTWLRYRDRMANFTVHVQNDTLLQNQYSVIAVNPKKYSYVQYDLAQRLIAFLTGKQGQNIIANYKIKGEQLFYPNAK